MIAPRLRIGLNAPHAYPLFDPTDVAAIGGLETRAWLFARGLAKRKDADVQFLVQAPRWFRRRGFGGVTVWNLSDGFEQMRRRVSNMRLEKATGSSPPFRFWWESACLGLVKTARRFGLTRDLSRMYDCVAADVYCTFGVSRLSAQLTKAAHARGRPVVLALASLDDLDSQFRPGSTYRTPHGEIGSECYDLLMTADAIVAQTSEQAAVLKARFDRPAQVIPNPFDLEDWDRSAASEAAAPGLRESPYILWIGRADRFHKRPELAFSVARACPDISFLMIMNRGEAGLWNELKRSAPSNVHIVEQAPFRRMATIFAKACGFLSTGAAAYEGCPNAFLQASASRIPVLSWEVDAAYVAQQKAGVVANGDRDALIAAVRRSWEDAAWRRDCGERGRTWVRDVHGIESTTAALQSVLAEVSAARVGRSG